MAAPGLKMLGQSSENISKAFDEKYLRTAGHESSTNVSESLQGQAGASN